MEKAILKTIHLLFITLLITACGSGGGESVPNVIDGDTTPVDGTAPDFTLNYDSINKDNETSVAITGSCTLDSEMIFVFPGVLRSTDCLNQSFSINIDLSTLPEGVTNFSTSATANSNQVSTSKQFTIFKDSLGNITSLSLPSAGDYNTTQSLDFSVTFTSAVIVDTTGGSPRLALDINGSTQYADYSSHSTNTILFSYNVGNGILDTDGLSFISTSIELNGAVISVAGASAATDFSSQSTDLSNVNVYGIVPTVSLSVADNITSANQGSYSVVGTCSNNGSNVQVSFQTTTVTVPCISNSWTSGSVDISSELDSANFSISAVHTDPSGNLSLTSNQTVDKTTNLPVVSIDTYANIDTTNVTSYTISGSCTENNQVVTVQIDSITSTPNCSSGSWSLPYTDMSAISDSASITITADHQNSGGDPATQASVTISKDLAVPTVTINSAPNVTISNQADYTISGSCSENTRDVSVQIDTLPFTATCSSGTWLLSAIDLSGLADSNSLNVTADHDNAGGDQATQATQVISKETTTPSVVNLAVGSTLINNAEISWNIENDSGFTINDYIVQYKKSTSTIWLQFDDGISTDQNTSVTSLNASTNYDFRVAVVYDTSNQSGWSNISTGETKPDNPIFTEFKAMNVGGADSSRVTAFEDNTVITLNGNPLITLNKGETHTFASTQFDIIDADKAIFTAGRVGSNSGGSGGANIVWQPSSWAGKSFSFNATRSSPQRLQVYPIESGTITVKKDSTVLDTTTMTAGVGTTLEWTDLGSYQIESTGMVLLFHYGASGGNYTDPKPIIGASNKLIGIPSSSMRLTASFDGTNYTAIHSNSTKITNNLDKADVINITPQGTSSLYQSESLLLTSDKVISGASYADSNGYCASVFLPTGLMKNAYAVNANSDYVAFASLKPGIIKVLDKDNNVLDALVLTRSGSDANAPYKARTGTTTAGTRFISTVPMAAWYQPNEYDGAIIRDETILYGTNLEDPTSSFTAPTNPITCKTLKDDNPLLTSGVYSIDPDGDGGNASFDAYCDMETQGGGWTLVIRYDRDLATASEFSLPQDAGRSDINVADMNSITASTNLAASIDIRPFIKGGATHFMHATTPSGDTNYTHTYFSDIYLTVRLNPEAIFDSSYDTDDNEGQNGGIIEWSESALNRWYESDFSVMTNTQTSGSNGNSMRAISGGEGSAMFTNGDREGALYSSGVSTSGTTNGHSSPKVQWGFKGKDGSQQSYGGTTYVGTYCRSSLGSGDCRPVERMNLMFVR